MYVLSHSHSIDDTELSEIISNVPETCFSKRSFEWVPKTGIVHKIYDSINNNNKIGRYTGSTYL